MKGKKTQISFVVIVLLISGIAAALAGFQPGTGETTKINLWDAADPTAAPVTYPDGQHYMELNDTYTVGETFTVIANVTNVTELNLYQVGVTYNDTILECTGYSEGATDQNFFYLNVDPAAYATIINKPMLADGSGFLGKWNHVTWALKKPYNASGTGVLAVFDFEVLDYGVTLIDIIISGAQVAILADPNNVDLDYNTIDIIFDNLGLTPAAHGPTADFTIAPPSPWYVDETLTFTGKNTSSEWGFTGYPDLEYCPIVTFDWDFGDGDSDSGIVVTHEYDTEGTYTVNLTVTDTRGWNDSVLVPVTIIPLAEGYVLDVYTQHATYNGTGPFMPSRPYRANKEEPVRLYAKVLYNNCPVANKFVVFTVFHVSGTPPSITFTPVEVRTASTSTNGIASVNYRIPTGSNNESHGAYFVYAYCYIANELVADALTYRVEWVNKIVDVVPLPPQSWHKSKTAAFNVTIQSWDFVALPLIISLTLYDALNVTIAETSIGPVGRPPSYPTPCDWWSPTRTFFGDGTYAGLMSGLSVPPAQRGYLICAQIPLDAYVGVGTAYVNIFDAWPILDEFAEPVGLQGDGQPWGPEMSAAFGIEC